jgi:hypothetical protein
MEYITIVRSALDMAKGNAIFERLLKTAAKTGRG